MNKDNFQASISGSFLILLLTFFFGIILGLTAMGDWGLTIGETSALLIATITFVSSFYHFYSLRKHQRLSVKPYLQINTKFSSVDQDDKYSFYVLLNNYGLGPAISKELLVELNNVKTKDVHDRYEEWVKLVNNETNAKGKAQCILESIEPLESIDKGQTIVLLAAHFPMNDVAFMAAREIGKNLSKKIKINIEYESHYGEIFKCVKREFS